MTWAKYLFTVMEPWLLGREINVRYFVITDYFENPEFHDFKSLEAINLLKVLSAITKLVKY